MKKLILTKRAILLSFFFLLSGCTASGALFKPMGNTNEQQSRIYLYRPVDFASLDYPVIKVDGNEIGTLRNLGFITFVVAPGKHEISVAHDFFTWPYRTLNFSHEFEGGKTYYYRVTLDLQRDLGKIHYRIAANPLPEGAAVMELQNLRDSK